MYNGIKTKSFDIGLTYFHYSNAGIKKPNAGLDTILFSLAFPIK
ncbi:MAG: acyloxyacyl hydrolase [Campylobacterota bacterium]|nr:acyloxyacyl hydrolase [Campylobacterota bacterium]